MCSRWCELINIGSRAYSRVLCRLLENRSVNILLCLRKIMIMIFGKNIKNFEKHLPAINVVLLFIYRLKGEHDQRLPNLVLVN